MSQQTLFADPATLTTTRPAKNYAPLVECDRCGFGQFIEAKIHGGRSTRLDCARCGLTLGFPVWYGRTTQLRQRPRQQATHRPLTVRSSEVDSTPR
jgi:hypothetical protein